MNGSRSPDTHNGHAREPSPHAIGAEPEAGVKATEKQQSPSAKSIQDAPEETKSGLGAAVICATDSQKPSNDAVVNGEDHGAESEAETLIDSPVKRLEMERRSAMIKTEKSMKSRIGCLPVPSGDEEEGDSMASPVESTEPSTMDVSLVEKVKSDADAEIDLESDKENSSGSLSSARTSTSRSSSRSRALSDRLELAQNGSKSPNPRKRKHRASSVGLPNKRASMEPPRRRLRGLQSESNVYADRSPSPHSRAHRRTTSTQSTYLEGGANGSKKRLSVPQFPVRDLKSAKNGWEESDASSETTSHGHNDLRRPQRGIGRSTSTPGRPGGREHKRHVNKYGLTRLAEACEAGDLDLVKDWRKKDPEQLELAEFAGNTPLQIAALNGNVEVAEYLIEQGSHIDCANVDKDTPLIDAAENGHVDMVRLLLKSGVDPMRQNLKGQQALDVVTDETEDADEIRLALRQAIDSWNSDGARQRREVEEEHRHRAGPKKELHFMARSYENLLKLVTINDRNGVREFLDARVPVDNAIIAAAAKTGDLYLVNMLFAEMNPKKAHQKAEKPMLSVLGTSHFEMVKSLTELDQFNPLYRSRAGKTWPELADERNGPMWRQERELLQRLYDERNRAVGRRSSSPVTQHENGKRRQMTRASDDDSDGAAPKRKNGRRLMSRRDMRAASGKSPAESDSDESNSAADVDVDVQEESSAMRPPASPTQRRGSGRLRTKSASSQHIEPVSPRLRRRSSSLRGLNESVLATVEERSEERVLEAEKPPVDNHAQEALFALQQAQRLDAERRQAEAAAAEAQREEERLAEEQRKADEARARVEAEETRRAEDLRIQEELRRQREAEMEHARRQHQEEVLAALPDALRNVHDETSAFAYDDTDAVSYLVGNFTPLLILKYGNSGLFDISDAREDETWVLNAQAAPLLGKRGLELLLDRTSLGFQRTFSEGWITHTDISSTEQRLIGRTVSDIAACPTYFGDEENESDIVHSFEQEKAMTARRFNAYRRGRKGLLEGAALYLVKLDDVLANLDPLLQGTSIPVRSLVRSEARIKDSALPQQQHQISAFMAGLGDLWAASTILSAPGEFDAPAHANLVVTTSVVAVHGK